MKANLQIFFYFLIGKYTIVSHLLLSEFVSVACLSRMIWYDRSESSSQVVFPKAAEVEDVVEVVLLKGVEEFPPPSPSHTGYSGSSVSQTSTPILWKIIEIKWCMIWKNNWTFLVCFAWNPCPPPPSAWAAGRAPPPSSWGSSPPSSWRLWLKWRNIFFFKKNQVQTGKCMQEEVIQKLVIRQGFLKNQLLGAKDLSGGARTLGTASRSTRQLMCVTIITRPGVLKSQRCVKTWTRSRPRKGQNAAEVFCCISPICVLCISARCFLDVDSA